jgi:aminopeptidase N
MAAFSHRSFHLPESKPHFAPPKEFRTLHRKIELTVDFQKKSISGSCTLDIEPIQHALGRAHIDACELDIKSCTVDGREVEFEYDNAVLAVPLPEKDGPHSVRVEYSASPKEGLYFTSPDAEHPEKEVQAWTHSEPEAARFWYPCHDHPSDKSSSEMVIRVPKGFRVISNGKLLSTEDEGESVVFHWKEGTPHSSYLSSFVAGRFGEITQEVHGLKLHYNFPESRREDVLRYFGETPRIIEVLEDLTGMKYPYEKYDQTTVQDFVAGGEENLNATTLAMNYYPEAGTEEDFQPAYSNPFSTAVNLVAHEAAHQWYGDWVTCSDWCHAWINEAWATYLQSLYVERTRGADFMRWEMGAREAEYFEEDEKEYRRPIVDREYVWPHDVFDHTTYRKGASMIHELRYIMGDDSFFRGTAEFLRRHAESCADTDDMRKAMEAVSGLQLEEFFDQAFLKPGYPEFRVDYEWDDTAKTATLGVKQEQNTSDGTPVFRLPCDIVFYVGGARKKFRVMLDSAEQTLVFSLAARPSVVEFDPERWLLKKVKFEKTFDLLENQLTKSQDAWSRAEAAAALGETGSDSAVQALRSAVEREQFWDVRACAMRALGNIGTDPALEAILQVGVPSDRRVRRAMAKALGSFKDERARKLLVAFLESDESPYVRCEAALSLAKSWPEGALPHLKKAMGVHSPNETLAEACLEAMGKLGGEEVKKIVDDNLAYGKPTRARVGALKAIKARGRIADDELPRLKEILGRDKEDRVRLYLISELVRELSDGRFLDALAEVSKKDRNGSVRRQALEVYYDLTGEADRAGALSRLKAEVEALKGEDRRPHRLAG